MTPLERGLLEQALDKHKEYVISYFEMEYKESEEPFFRIFFAGYITATLVFIRLLSGQTLTLREEDWEEIASIVSTLEKDSIFPL